VAAASLFLEVSSSEAISCLLELSAKTFSKSATDAFNELMPLFLS
jgi:hypothetical protein